MKVPEAKVFVKALVEHQVPLTPCLVGAMGIGKSQIVTQVADELGIDLIDLRLAQMETGDLVGIPYERCTKECVTTKGETIHGKHKTLWAAPGWWPEENTKGILFLDECLIGKTQILTDKGRRSISDIYRSFQNGEIIHVKSFNERTNIFEFKKVTMAWNKGKKDVIGLHFNNIKRIGCTPNHPILTASGYKEAQNLVPGDKVVAYIESKEKTATPALNSDQLQAVYGSILGDGCFNTRENGSRYLSVIHGETQKKYLMYKANIFNADVRKLEKNGFSQKPAYVFHTRLISELYGEKKSTIKKLVLNKIDVRGLAVWYMDDGNKSTSADVATLHTESWETKDIEFAVSRLCSMGYECHIQAANKKDGRKFNVIYLTAKGFKRFSKDIAPFAHPTMKYKLIEEDRNMGFVTLNNKFLNYGYFIFTKFCKVPNEKFEGTKRYVYDLEVEDNHNFVVASKETNNGAVVHNCNRAPNDVRQAVFQLILADHKGNRKLHTHILPKGWSVVTAMNPDNGDYQVETLDPAMIRRFIMLDVQADVESWLLWAKTNNDKGEPRVDPAITAFIAANKSALNKESLNNNVNVERSSDAWTMLSDLRRKNVIPYEAEFEIMAGIVGKEFSTAFRKWLDANYKRPVNGEEILNKYDEVVERLLEQRNDEWYATKLDLLTHLATNKELNKKQTENLKRFIKACPTDIQAAFVQGLPPELIHKLTKDDDILTTVAKKLSQVNEGK